MWPLEDVSAWARAELTEVLARADGQKPWYGLNPGGKTGGKKIYKKKKFVFLINKSLFSTIPKQIQDWMLFSNR